MRFLIFTKIFVPLQRTSETLIYKSGFTRYGKLGKKVPLTQGFMESQGRPGDVEILHKKSGKVREKNSSRK